MCVCVGTVSLYNLEPRLWKSNPVVFGESLRTSLLVNGNRTEVSPKESTDSQEEEEEEPSNSQGQQTAIPQGQSRMSAAYSLGE